MTTTEKAEGSILARAHAAIPDHAMINAALDDVGERLRTARNSTTPETDVAAAALAAIITGQPVPDDLGDQVLVTRKANERAMADAQALARLHDQLLHVLRDRHRDGADEGLAVLRGELDAILTEARPILDELGAVSDPGEAIATDRVTEWQQAQRLADQLAELRRAQRVLTSGAVDPPDQAVVRSTHRITEKGARLVDLHGHVRAADKWHPEMGAGIPALTDEQPITRTREVDGRVITNVHANHPAAKRPPWWTGDALADLRFIVRDDVDAWVPGVDELRAARTEHEQRREAEARAAAGTLDEPVSLAWGSPVPTQYQQRAAFERRRSTGVDIT